MTKTMTSFVALMVASSSVLAHEGHGLPGASHWHASDLVGYGLALAVGLAVLWFRRK